MVERKRGVLSKLVGEVLNTPSISDAQKKERKLRKERREAFLTRANELLGKYGYISERRKGDEITPIQRTNSVGIQAGDKTIDVYLSKYVFFYKGDITRVIGIEADLSGQEEPYTLFCVEQNVNTFMANDSFKPQQTIIRNQIGVTASNEEVKRGLQALHEIGRKLSNQRKTK